MFSKPPPVLELEYAHEILERVRALSVRHEALLAGFWNPLRETFGLEEPDETTDHVTSSCTCVLSWMRVSVCRRSPTRRNSCVGWSGYTGTPLIWGP